jgi:small-conductance mechanosensitive channel
LAKKLLLEIAAENKDVLEEPKSAVRLMKFGDSSIDLQLWVWTKDKLQRKSVLISDLNFAIWEKFRANNIEIPFPQTDLHIKSGELGYKKSIEKVNEPINSDGETELDNSVNYKIDENQK